MATRTWRTDHRGFFFPQPLGFLHEEEKTHHAQDKMAHQRQVAPHFEMVKPHLPFSVFEHPFDVPAAEGHVEQDFGGGLLGGVGQKVLYLAAQYVAGHDKPAFFSGKLVFAGVEPYDAGVPDQRSLVRVLDVKALPGRTAPFPQLVHPPRPFGAGVQAWFGGRSSRGGRALGHCQARTFGPSAHRFWDQYIPRPATP